MHLRISINFWMYTLPQYSHWWGICTTVDSQSLCLFFWGFFCFADGVLCTVLYNGLMYRIVHIVYGQYLSVQTVPVKYTVLSIYCSCLQIWWHTQSLQCFCIILDYYFGDLRIFFFLISMAIVATIDSHRRLCASVTLMLCFQSSNAGF